MSLKAGGILSVLLAAMVALASAPRAGAMIRVARADNPSREAQTLDAPGGPVEGVVNPSRGVGVDLRETRAAFPTFGAAACCFGHDFAGGSGGEPVAGRAGPSDATLLSLHCLLTV